MANKFESTPSERQEILNELKEIAHSESPLPQEDWDLVWVLSGDDSSINNIPDDNKRNETRDRVETGLSIARSVAAIRTGKKFEDVTVQDIAENGPVVYFNGTGEQNRDLKESLSLNWDFPAEKFVVSESDKINHTGDQFDEIPSDMLGDKRKVIIVSSLYHLPRIKRYIEKYSEKIVPEKIVLFPSEPRRAPVGKTLGEIKKIPKYRKEGIL